MKLITRWISGILCALFILGGVFTITSVNRVSASAYNVDDYCNWCMHEKGVYLSLESEQMYFLSGENIEISYLLSSGKVFCISGRVG